MSDYTIDSNISESAVLKFKAPQAYKMIVLRGMVIFPRLNFSFDVAREKSVFALNKAIENDEKIFLAAQKNAALADPAPKDIYRIGTICKIKQVLKMPGDTLKVLAEGLERGEID